MEKKNFNNLSKSASGFTLIEVLIVIGILAILAGIVLVAVNPARQFSQARDSQRMSNVASILNALGQNIVENKGSFNCESAGDIPEGEEDSKEIKSEEGGVNLYDCLVPNYLAEIPVDPDPEKGSPYDEDSGEYNTGYKIFKTPAGRITIFADGELEENISVTR